MDKNGETKMDDAVWQEIPVIKTPVYKINERPKTWWECLLFGWQHTLVDISPFVLPLAVAGAIGIPIYTQFVLGEQWLDRLHVSLKLVATNTVVLAVIIAIILNLILNIILRGTLRIGTKCLGY